jgi:hypothetical protein
MDALGWQEQPVVGHSNENCKDVLLLGTNGGNLLRVDRSISDIGTLGKENLCKGSTKSQNK